LISNITEFCLSIASGGSKRQKLILLIYHRVIDQPDYMYPSSITTEEFNWQFALLASKFNVLPLTEALERLQSGSLPPKAVCITFDDGYADNYLHAMPILKQYSLPASFFVVSGMINQDRMWNDDVVETVRCYPEPVLDLGFLNLGRHSIKTADEKFKVAERLVKTIKYLPFSERNRLCKELTGLVSELPTGLMLTSQQIRHLSDQGFEIGSHSVNHPILKGLAVKEWRHEILSSKAELENITGKQVKCFAYPNGKFDTDFSHEHCQYVKECGYTAALSTDWGCVTPRSDIWMLPRFTPWDHTPNRFLLRMAQKYLFA